MNFNKENEVGEVTNTIVEFAQKLNLEVDSEDIIQLLKNDVEELTNQNLIEIEKERAREKKTKKLDEHNDLPKKLCLKIWLQLLAKLSMESNNLKIWTQTLIDF